MPITISSQPDKWSSAYRPIRFVFGSDLLPNGNVGDVNIPILSITEDAYGTRVTIASQFITSVLSAGETLLIQGTGSYDGTHRVTSTFESGGQLIAYIATPWIGDVTVGTASRYYQGLQVVVEATFANTGRTVTFDLSPDEDDRFTIDLSECAARQFDRIFDDVPQSLGWDTIHDSTPSIATEYDLKIYERWILWEEGQPTQADSSKVATLLKGFRAINCVHPYHKEEDTGINVDWATNLTDILPLFANVTGRRFLTWSRASDRLASESDDFFVSFLAETNTPLGTVRAFVTTYAANGTPIGVVGTGEMPVGIANTINVGPSVIPSGTITSSVDYYTVRIIARNGVELTEALRINIDRTCSEADRRVHWRNKLGGIDQFTMRGREFEDDLVDREGLRRVNGRLADSPFLGTWSRRTHRTDPTRRHILTSALLPARTVRYLNEDCFESADHAIVIRDGWWTNLVIESADSARISTTNDNQRFVLSYSYGMDNLSQRA